VTAYIKAMHKPPPLSTAKPSPDSEVEEFLRKIDFVKKDWTFVVHKHDGWKGIHTINKDGQSHWWDKDHGNHIHSGPWELKGAVYVLMGNMTNWSGKFEITGEGEHDFIIHYTDF
jgi:hypothetical protein